MFPARSIFPLLSDLNYDSLSSPSEEFSVFVGFMEGGREMMMETMVGNDMWTSSHWNSTFSMADSQNLWT